MRKIVNALIEEKLDDVVKVTTPVRLRECSVMPPGVPMQLFGTGVFEILFGEGKY